MEDTNSGSVVKRSGSSGSFLVWIFIGIFALLVIWFLTQKPPAGTNTELTATDAVPSAAMVSPSPVSSSPPVEGAMTALTVSVEGGAFYFKPNVITVKKDQPVKIILNSVGGMPHDFVIDEFNVKSSQVANSSVEVEFTPDQIGTFEFYCSVGQHRANGMKGQLIVQ